MVPSKTCLGPHWHGRVNDCRRTNAEGGRGWPRTGVWEQAGCVWRWEETVSQAPYQPHNNQPSFKSFCRQGADACFLFTPPKMCCPAIFKVTAAQTAPPLQVGLPPPWTILTVPKQAPCKAPLLRQTDQKYSPWEPSGFAQLAQHTHITSTEGEFAQEEEEGGEGGPWESPQQPSSPSLVWSRPDSGIRILEHPVRCRQRRTCSSTLSGDETGSTKQGAGRLLMYAFLLKRSSWRGWDSRSFQNVTVDGDIIIPLMQILKIHASFLTIRKMVPQRLVLRTTAIRVNSNNDLKGKLLICTISECKLFPQKC